MDIRLQAKLDSIRRKIKSGPGLFTPTKDTHVRTISKNARKIIRRLCRNSNHTRHTKKSVYICCVFHTERTPSLRIDKTNGKYHCFGCGAQGDVWHLARTYPGVQKRKPPPTPCTDENEVTGEDELIPF